MSRATEDLLFSILSTLIRIEQHVRPHDSVTIQSATAQAVEEGSVSMKLTGIRASGIRVKDGKVIKTDSRPPHVKQKHRRTKGKVTGARRAK